MFAVDGRKDKKRKHSSRKVSGSAIADDRPRNAKKCEDRQRIALFTVRARVIRPGPIGGGTSSKSGETAMSTKNGVTAAVLMVAIGWTCNASAQESDEVSDQLEELRELDSDARREAIEAMSDDERKALRESSQDRKAKQRENRESMTPDEREAAKQERRERFESMSPEQQDAMRERRGERQQTGNRSSRDSQGSSGRGRGRRGNRPTGDE